MLGILRGVFRGAKRGPLSPKQGNKNFYKGYGAKSAGRLTSKGKKRNELRASDSNWDFQCPCIAYSTKLCPRKFYLAQMIPI